MKAGAVAGRAPSMSMPMLSSHRNPRGLRSPHAGLPLPLWSLGSAVVGLPNPSLFSGRSRRIPNDLSLGVADMGLPRPSRRPGRGRGMPRVRSPGGAVSGRPHPSEGDAVGPQPAKEDMSCPSGDPSGGGIKGSDGGS